MFSFFLTLIFLSRINLKQVIDLFVQIVLLRFRNSCDLCVQEEETRALVKSNGGLEPLVELIKDHTNHENKELMAAVTGTIITPLVLMAAVTGTYNRSLHLVLLTLIKEHANHVSKERMAAVTCAIITPCYRGSSSRITLITRTRSLWQLSQVQSLHLVLVKQIKDNTNHENKELMPPVTGKVITPCSCEAHHENKKLLAAVTGTVIIPSNHSR